MGFLDKVKEKTSDFAKYGELVQRVQKGKKLSEDEREYFVERSGKSPEVFKEEFDRKQNEKVQKKNEKQRIADEIKKERMLSLSIPKTFMSTSKIIYIRRDKNDLFYFNDKFSDKSTRFIFQSYEWAGPNVETKSISKTTGNTKTKGRMGRALLGGVVLGPVGAIVGASGKRKSDTNSTTITKHFENEKDGTAKFIFKAVDTDKIEEISVVMNSKKNAEIESFFQNINVNTTSNYNDLRSPVDQVKELKELLDLDIITQEEFDIKKKELLDL